MTDKILLLVLWICATGGILFAILNWPDRDRPWKNRPLRIGGLPGGIGIIAAALFMLLLTACSPPVVTSTPAACSTLLPESWREGVAGAQLPDGDTAGDWIAFGDAQTGKLDQANGRTRDSIDIVRRCEERDAKAVKRATRGFLGRLFGR